MGAPDRNADLRSRTKNFALRVIRLFALLPKTPEAQILGKQFLRSGTSVGAHYRESMRARSTAEFISKIEGGLQELEETLYWLELIQDMEFITMDKVVEIVKEANELMAILVFSVKKVKAGMKEG